MRKLKATSLDGKKSKADLVSKFLVEERSSNPQIATWTIEHAQRIKLVVIDENSQAIWLDRQHGYVNMLDRKEAVKVSKLLQLVMRKSRNPEGWVPKPVVISEMDRALEFGYSRQEQEYWLGQAIHYNKLMQAPRPGQDGRPQTHLRVASR